jgi:uncharacterized protein (DUF427 family)
MAVPLSRHLMSVLPELRIHPVGKWVRARVGDDLVVDSRRAMLVWEPRRVVPSYAVPRADVAGRLVPHQGEEEVELPVRLAAGGPEVLDPRTPFLAHSCAGQSLTLLTGRGGMAGAAFAPADPDLEGYVVLDWEAFTEWREEEEQVFGHPHDPFARIDCLRSSRHVVLSAAGQVVADSTRATLLFETSLPTRYYLPAEDVRMDLLVPSDKHTVCAYKGTASYWSLKSGDVELPSVAWSYPEPLHDAVPVRGLVAFFTERLDLELDGVARDRPVTPWS